MSVTTIDLASLTRKQNPAGSDILHLKDPITGKDHYVLLSDIQSGTSYDSWDPETEYSMGDRVTFGFRLWESLQNTNEGNTPQEGAWWKEVSESAKPDKLEKVIAKSAHGFVAGNVLTLDGTGVLVKVSDPATDKFIGIVTEVIDVNNFRLVIAGYAELAGLTPGTLYYAQSDGTLGATASDMPVLKADAIGGYILASGSGGSSSQTTIDIVYANIAAMLADQGNQEENNYYWVTDASTDPTVDAGWAIYRKLAASTADLSDYVKVQEQEGIDITINDASTTQKGIIEIADSTEAQLGTDTEKAMTPALVAANTRPGDQSGTVVAFNFPSTHGRTTPETGNITADYTNAVVGNICKVYHEHSAIPTFPGDWVNIGENEYVPNTLNIIVAEYVRASGNRVEYFIVNPLAGVSPIMRYINIDLSASEFKNCGSSPATLIAAVAEHWIEIVDVTMEVVNGNQAFNFTTATNLLVMLSSGSGYSFSFAASTINGISADSFMGLRGVAPSNYTLQRNQSIVLTTNNASNSTDGNGSARITIAYRFVKSLESEL